MELINITFVQKLDGVVSDSLRSCASILGITKIARIEKEPGDGSTDLGGLVSLADLGYEEVARDVSIEAAAELSLPEPPFCFAYIVTEAEYLNTVTADMGHVSGQIRCVELRFGDHEVSGCMHLPSDLDGWMTTDDRYPFRTVRSNYSIGISGEADGDRLELIKLVATHPRTKKAIADLQTASGPLSIFI